MASYDDSDTTVLTNFAGPDTTRSPAAAHSSTVDRPAVDVWDNGEVIRLTFAAFLLVFVLFNLAGLAFWGYALLMGAEIDVRGGVVGLLFGVGVTALAMKGLSALTRPSPVHH